MGDRFGEFIDGGEGGVGDKDRVRGEGVGIIGLRGDGLPGTRGWRRERQLHAWIQVCRCDSQITDSTFDLFIVDIVGIG